MQNYPHLVGFQKRNLVSEQYAVRFYELRTKHHENMPI